MFLSQTTRLSVTEFKGAPAAALRRVRSGQVIEITLRGQVVARIEPVTPSQEVPSDDPPSLQASLARIWQEHGAGVPDDPFDGVTSRAKGKAREVRW